MEEGKKRFNSVRELGEALAAPFKEEELEHRIARCGEKNGKAWARYFTYVTSRAIMDRLDDIFGLTGWRDQYEPGPNGGVKCGLSLKINGEWHTRWDGADNTQVESVKGGISDSFKRAAVKFGIGRYLYKLEENQAIIGQGNYYHSDKKKGLAFKWSPQPMHSDFLPKGEKAKPSLPSGENGQAQPETIHKQAEPAPNFDKKLAVRQIKQAIVDWMIKNEDFKLTEDALANRQKINEKLYTWFQKTLDEVTPDLYQKVMARV